MSPPVVDEEGPGGVISPAVVEEDEPGWIMLIPEFKAAAEDASSDVVCVLNSRSLP